jgi:hypothetical protein
MAAGRLIRGRGTGVMYAFLLALGAVIIAAGLALVASGVSIQEHAFDLTNITPGAIAVIGGCILIGLAFVVRALLRVEQALIARPMPRPLRPGETVGAAAAQASGAARIPFPPKSNPVPQPQPAAIPAAAGAASAEETLLGAPTSERLENAPVVEESDVSLLPKAPVRSDEETAELQNGAAAKPNGAAHVKTATPVAVSGRPMRQPQQSKGSLFDSLWPKPQRQAAEAQAVSAGQAAAQPEQGSEAPSQSVAAAPAAPAAVTIIKSGVVEGMAYTLYSDGSIEAQLPGGTLRFGSITELRNHIEQNG